MKKDKDKIKKGLIIFFMILCILPILFLIVFIITNSFISAEEFTKNYGMIKDGFQNQIYARIHLIPKSLSLNQYKSAFWEKSDFWYYFWNSVMISGTIMVGTVLVSVLSGYAFAKLEFPLKKFAFLIVILIMMLPYQIMLAPQLMLFQKINMLDTRSSIILPNIFTTFGTFLIYQFIVKIPDETLEAAKVDGAGHYKILTRIILPQIANGVSALIILNLIDTWNLIEQPLVFLQNQYKYPLSVILSESDQLFQVNIFANCVVFLIPILLMFLACKDSLMEGIQSSVLIKNN